METQKIFKNYYCPKCRRTQPYRLIWAKDKEQFWMCTFEGCTHRLTEVRHVSGPLNLVDRKQDH